MPLLIENGISSAYVLLTGISARWTEGNFDMQRRDLGLAALNLCIVGCVNELQSLFEMYVFDLRLQMQSSCCQRCL